MSEEWLNLMYVSQLSILDYFQNCEVGEISSSHFLIIYPVRAQGLWWISTAILMKLKIKAK